MSRFRYAALAVLLLLIPALAPASIINGDFESGDTGFDTGYGMYPGSGLLMEDYCAWVKNPQSVNHWLASFGDHTTGSGWMMVYNGATGQVAWRGHTDSPILPEATYEFSFWAASAFHDNPSVLDIRVAGTSLGTFALGGEGVWMNYTAKFVAPALATLEIWDTEGVYHGNDFVLDDISLREVEPPPEHMPEPGTFLLLGAGLVAVAGFSRRK